MMKDAIVKAIVLAWENFCENIHVSEHYAFVADKVRRA